MKAYSNKIQQRFAVYFLLVSMLASSMTWGAVTDLADLPMAVKNTVPPNLMFVLDDSGSMGFEILLQPTNDGALWWHTGDQSFVGRDSADALVSGTINFNQAGNANSTWKKYGYLFPNGTGTGERTYGDSTDDHFAVPPTAAYAWLRSSTYNVLYYNPATNYTTWNPSNDGSTTTTYTAATPAAAKSDPVYGSSTLDLTSNINSQTSNWTFRMWPGMVAPVGAYYNANGSGTWVGPLAIATTVPALSYWDVQISYYPATYYVLDSTGTFIGPDGAKLKEYQIKAGNTFPSGRTYAAEMQNFANWFSYYRKRQLMLNEAMGSAVDGLTGLRGGLVRFNNRSAVTMYDFSNASDALNQKRLLDIIYKVAPGGGTPTRDALDYAGQQFMRTDGSAPVIASCQFNISMVFTDGFASNSSSVSISPANYDGQTDYTTYPYNRQYNSNNAITLTHPYQDTYGGTIADIAMKYYTTNIRADLTAGLVPVNPLDVGPDADRNPNLHMNTYALGLGVKGTIFGTGSAAASNPYTTAPVWPDPNASSRSPAGVDDLWHAALNGRGDMFNATDPAAVRTSLDTVINSVFGKAGAAAAVTVSNPNIVVGGVNASYNSNYNSGSWTGDLIAYPVDTSTGAIGGTPIWATTAKAQLDVRNPVGGIYSNTARSIVTYSGVGSSTATGTGGLQFQPSGTTLTAGITTKLTAAQEAAFNSTTTPPGPSDAAAVIAYLRGDRSGEVSTYRSRAYVLGDIINAEPVMVQAPAKDYTDTCYSVAVSGTCAQSFKTAQVARPSVLFQASNDGLVHAFTASNGAESWAYLPKLIWPNLVNRTKKKGFTHQYYIDGTPVTGDVDFRQTNGGGGAFGGSIYGTTPAWRTLLVGGLGKGGQGYYALDVTDPAATSELNAASKVLWEFPNSTTSTANSDNMGYSFARPILAKTAAEGWVVIVPSGYNNVTGTADGHGRLYVLNPRNGAVIQTIDTGVGSTTTPAGLAKISAYVENGDLDNTVKYVYGGDLLGNVWRFDLTDTNNSNQWNVKRLATLVDTTGAVQPVTTEPELAVINISGTDYHFVYVGTGEYLGDSDIPTTQRQTMYGLVDDLSNSPTITIGSARTQLQGQALTTASGTARSVTNNAIAYTGGSAKKGWYVDLTLTAGERIVTDPQLALGALIFTTNIPSATQCVPGGSSWLYSLNYQTGGVVTGSPPASFPGQSLGTALASRPTLIKLPSGEVKAIVRLSDTTTRVVDVPIPLTATSGKRISWKEIITN